jgi:acyl-coenzyme A thioesterase PaaI-like protein
VFLVEKKEGMSADVPTETRVRGRRTTEAAALDWAAPWFTALPITGPLGARDRLCLAAVLTDEFQGQRDFCNLTSSVQGGMLTAMLDLAMSFATMHARDDGQVVALLEMKTTFLAPARGGLAYERGYIDRKRPQYHVH